MTFTFPPLQKSLFTPTMLPAHQKSPRQNCLFTRLTLGSCCVFLMWMLFASSAMAQSWVLPAFKYTSGTVLSNTNGNWIRVNPAQPDNIDLIESRIFEMPKKGNGIVAIEFKLIGADGGTAHYQSGAYNQFANGGKGGEVNFTLNLANTKTYGRAFFVTFGKKGESTRFDWGLYCSAGGGGSTGMSWLYPGIDNKYFSYPKEPFRLGQLIAGAGGGSGGFATAFESVNGKSAIRDNGSDFQQATLNNYESTWIVTTASDIPLIKFVAGGSSASTLR